MRTVALFELTPRSVLGLVAALAVLAGCGAGARSDAASSQARFDCASDEIAAREKSCLDAAATKVADRLSQIGTTAFADLDGRAARSDFYWAAWQCRVAAARATEKVAEAERAQYSRETNSRQEVSARMAILLSSRPH